MRNQKIAPRRAIFYGATGLLLLFALVMQTRQAASPHQRTLREKKFYPHMDTNPRALALARSGNVSVPERGASDVLELTRDLLTSSPDELLTADQIRLVYDQTPPLFETRRIDLDEARQMREALTKALLTAIDAEFRLTRDQLFTLQTSYAGQLEIDFATFRDGLGVPIATDEGDFQIVSGSDLTRLINSVVLHPERLPLFEEEEWRDFGQKLGDFWNRPPRLETPTEGEIRRLFLKRIATP